MLNAVTICFFWILELMKWSVITFENSSSSCLMIEGNVGFYLPEILG